MSLIARFVGALAIAVTLPPAVLSEPVPQTFERMGAYVTTDDIDRAVAFYSILFAKDPAVALPDFVAFDIAGGWFALVSRARYAPGSMVGAGAVPYIQSSSLELLQTRIVEATGQSAPALIAEPGITLLKVHDPDGQLVEFFTLTTP